MRTYELWLTDNRIVTWEGRTGEDAARRYVDCHRDTAVKALREPRTHLAIGVSPSQIIG